MFSKRIYVVLLILVILCGCSSKDIQEGNTTANENSQKSDNNIDKNYNHYIFFANNLDNKKLYRITSNGTGLSKINDDKLSDDIVKNNNYIFYVNRISTGNKELIRIDQDGSNRTVLLNEDIDGLKILNDWIYYINVDDGQLYKISTDGITIKRLTELTKEYVVDYQFYKDQIFYKKYGDSRARTIKLDGSGNEILNFNIGIVNFNIYGEHIYFPDEDEEIGKDNEIYRVNLDGKEKLEIAMYRIEYGLKADSNNLFLWSSKGLFKMGYDGTNKTILSNDNISEVIEMDSNSLYYWTDKKLVKVSKNGDNSLVLLN